MNIRKHLIQYITIFVIALISISPTLAATNFKNLPDLKLGDTNSLVKEVQKVLNNNGFTISDSGSGSRGYESNYFGSLTKKALTAFQLKYGINPASGYFGAKTKAKVQELFANNQISNISSGTPVAYGSDTCTTASQYGITWTFDKAYPCGQFANGDWWVVGPVGGTVGIKDISPKGTTSSGSMIGPDMPGSWNINHGFDSRIEDNVFDQNLNIATKLPYSMAVNKSLISSISSTAATPRYQLTDQAILTTLSSVPPEGSFRPTYFGSDKTIRWNKSQIAYSKLSKAIPSSLFSNNMSAVESGNIRSLVMLGMKDSYKGTHLIASNNQPYYGGDVTKTNAYAAMALNSNLTDAQKEKLAIGFIQKGIDIYEGVVRGNYTVPGGGYPYGYKTPLFFAGVLLNDSDILKYADATTVVPKQTYTDSSGKVQTVPGTGEAGFFAEDKAYYYTDSSDLNTRAFANQYGLSGGVGCSLSSNKTSCDIGRTIAPYTTSMVGMPEWGNEGHNSYASSDWGSIYRDVTGPNLIGVALAVQLMGAENVWNNKAFFDYVNQRAWPFWSSYFQGGLADNWAYKPVSTDANGNYSNLVDDFIDKAWIATRSPIGTIPSSYVPKGAVSSAWPKGPYPSNYPAYGSAGSVVIPPVATTTPTTYTLTTSTNGTGTGTISGASATYTSGATATLTATAGTNSTFTGWSGACTGTGTCSILMSSAKTVTATFTLNTAATTTPVNYSLTTSTSGTGTGSILGALTSYVSGATASLTASAGSGSTFTGWSGACTGTSTTCSIVMNAAKSVVAAFTLNSVTPPPATGTGMLLSVNPNNPRYFRDATGKTVYLAGNHSWSNGLESFDNTESLNTISSEGLNFIRMWRQEPWHSEWGYGNAPYNKDASGKYILTSFNQAYFDNIRTKVSQAKAKGIYVDVMLADGWWTHEATGEFAFSPYNPANNTAGWGSSITINDMHTTKEPYLSAQKAYATKVLETLKDMDNVLYEVGNELPANSASYNTAIVAHVKSWEANSANGSLKHPVGVTSTGGGSSVITSGVTNSYMLGSSSGADWISLGQREGADFLNNPQLAPATKPNIADTDHINETLNSTVWPWQMFMRGHNPIVLDSWREDGSTPSAFSNSRKAFGQTVAMSKKVSLEKMTPSNSSADCSTSYCLRDTVNDEYVAWNANVAAITLKVNGAGSYTYSIYSPTNVATALSTGTFTATAGMSQSFATVSGLSGGMVVHVKKTGTTPTTTYTLTTSTLGTGTGTISGNTSPYTSGATATLTATPAANSTFTGWSGACTGTGTCSVVMNAAKSVSATFTAVVTPVIYTLTTSTVGTGTISGNTTPYTSGATATLTATAGNGYVFSSWSGCTSTSGTTCTVSMTSNKAVTATFTAAPVTTYTLTTSTAGTGTGTISGNTSPYTSGATATLTATPASGSTFTGWSGSCTGTGTCSVVMNAAKSVTATFTTTVVNPTTYTLTTSKAGTGTGTIVGVSSGSTVFTSGQSVTLTATADANSTFSGWSGACTGTGTCSISMTANKSVTATFTLNPVTPPTTGFAIGSYVSVKSTPGTRVRSSASTSGTLLGSPTTGSTGQIIEGPISADGFVWWKIDFTSATDGWTIQDNLTVTGSGTTPTPTPTTYTLTTSTAGTGTGTISGNNSPYASGATATLTATPAANSTFTGWSGACTGTGTCSVVINTAKSVTATFTLNTVTPPTAASKDDLLTISGPTTVELGKTYDINLTYDATVQRDIVVDVYLYGSYLAGGRVTVPAGIGQNGKVQVTIPNTSSLVNKKILYYAYILPVGSNYGTQKDTISQENVSVIAAGTTIGSYGKGFIFMVNLMKGISHPDVKNLQKFLNSNGYNITTSGSGSTGNETTYFGQATKDALIRYQTDKGITPAEGYFGEKTRKIINGN